MALYEYEIFLFLEYEFSINENVYLQGLSTIQVIFQWEHHEDYNICYTSEPVFLYPLKNLPPAC